MGKRSKINPVDAALFRRAVETVRPLRQDKVALQPKRPPPKPVQTQRDAQQVLIDLLSLHYDSAELETGEELYYLRRGIESTVLRKLRRGHYSVAAELDLHGMTVPVAREAIARFLRECRARDVRCLKIIHGKGRGSRHRGPILKNKLSTWLRQRKEVIAFCSARAIDGGTGATYILLQWK
jgi:Uncharacterized protein conserved in bacteria